MTQTPSRGPLPDHLAAIARGVKLLVLDADGVLTDGSVNLDANGVEFKSFNVRDGLGLRLWMRLGFEVAIITGRSGGALRARAQELGISTVLDGISHKATALTELLARLGMEAREAAYVADDWPDLPALGMVGLPIAVANAEPAVIEAARWTTPRPGGGGAVRDAIEAMLAAKGLLERARSLATGDPAPARG